MWHHPTWTFWSHHINTLIKSPAEMYDIFVLSSMQRCEEWKRFQSYSTLYSLRCQKVVQNASASSKLTLSRFKMDANTIWFFSPWSFFVGLPEKYLYLIHGPPLEIQVIDSWRFTICNGRFYKVVPRMHHCRWGEGVGAFISLFPKS